MSINYNKLQNQAMLDIVKGALIQSAAIEEDDRPCIYITFDTRCKGVILSSYLKHKYPVEMTIILQYQFEDLHILDDRISVMVNFSGDDSLELLVIPFNALRVFLDADAGMSITLNENGDEYDDAPQHIDKRNSLIDDMPTDNSVISMDTIKNYASKKERRKPLSSTSNVKAYKPCDGDDKKIISIKDIVKNFREKTIKNSEIEHNDVI